MTGNEQQSRQQFRELIKDIRFAMLTTRGRGGVLHARPMTTQSSPADDEQGTGQLWFFMSRSSEAAEELTADPHVNVAYADTGQDAYVSVSGRARVVDDIAMKRQLWSKMNEAWFPRGVDDPDLALVRVDMTEAEYWNVTDSKLMQVARIALAAVAGDEPPNVGDHVKVRQV
ncbi:MAG TPA: pyridoxamine 5'-phosphate oxidase family protein [Burkholderiaceae bacterium]|nr:pyridoxamine 5'-phosphate oxidase family protein [Burkholderiaceae bacterium]